MSMGMWADVLLNTAISKISAHTPVYVALFVTCGVLLVPWIVMVSPKNDIELVEKAKEVMQGWYSTKNESPGWSITFLGLGFVFVAGWSIMFYSIVYRW